jgi:hypothetical protein
MVNIGGAYDFYLTKDSSGLLKTHRFSVNLNYTSNSFSYDNFMAGLEYSWKEILMLRGGMFAENELFKGERRNAFTGPAMGATFELPFNEKRSTVGLDYSYRWTAAFGGTHSFGLRVNL